MRISDWSSDVCSSDLGRWFLSTGVGTVMAKKVRLRRHSGSEETLSREDFSSSSATSPVESSPAARRSTRRLFTSKPTTSRSEEHTSELQSLMRISYAVFCLKKKKNKIEKNNKRTI